MKAIWIRAGFLVIVGIVSTSILRAAVPFTPGNILLTRNGIFQSSTDYLYEYTTAGVLVQTIPIDRPAGLIPSVGDTAYDSQGRVHIVQEAVSSSPISYISTLDPATNTWTHTPAPIDASNGSDLDLGIFGEHIFQQQMRMNVNTHDIAIINPGSPETYSETSVGRDGLLYSIKDQRDIQRTDPFTLQKIGGQLRLLDPAGGVLDGRGIAVTPQGLLLVADWNGTIFKYNASGTFLSELDTGVSGLHGIDLRSDGMVMTYNIEGDIVFTDVNFTTTSKFNIGKSNSLNEDTFASFVELPIPEASAAAILITGVLVAGLRDCARRRRCTPTIASNERV